MDENPTDPARRKAIKAAVTLLGGTLTAAQLGPFAARAAAMAEDAEARFLSPRQFSMVERIADTIIPETDTPGALTAGVHRFIDLMLAEWASPERRARFVQGLEDIDARARETGVHGFAASSKAQQLTLLKVLDREAHAEGASPDMFFRELKKLVLFSYYSSRVGATVELRYQPIPGDYLPCVPMDDATRAWFWMGYSYGL